MVHCLAYDQQYPPKLHHSKDRELEKQGEITPLHDSHIIFENQSESSIIVSLRWHSRESDILCFLLAQLRFLLDKTLKPQ